LVDSLGGSDTSPGVDPDKWEAVLGRQPGIAVLMDRLENGEDL
jgi:hypothetical protein